MIYLILNELNIFMICVTTLHILLHYLYQVSMRFYRQVFRVYYFSKMFSKNFEIEWLHLTVYMLEFLEYYKKLNIFNNW